MRHSVSIASAGAVSLLLIDLVHADETVLQEVVVTAALHRNLLDIAQPADVVSGDDLTRQLAGSLGETLSSQLGVSSTYFGPTASRPVIRGLGGYRVQTLQDGLATLDVGSLSDDHASTVDPALAEQIEILRGPATLLYGSGAAGGLVNVVTNRIPTRLSAETLAGTLAETVNGIAEVRGGSAADEKSGVASLTARAGSFAFHGDAARSRSEAIEIPGPMLSKRLRDIIVANGGIPEGASGSVPNAFSDNQGGAVGASWLGERALAGASVSRFESEYGIPSEEEAFIDMQQGRVDAKAEWRSEAGWLRGAEISGAYNDYTHTEYEAPGEPATVFTQDAYEIRASVDHAHRDGWRGTFGAQVTRLDFVAAGDEAFVPPSLTEGLGVFILEELDLGDWTFSLGARFERQSIDVVATGLPNFDDGAMSVAGGAVYKFTAEGSLALSVTHTGRHPQATELYAEGPHIAAQRFELGDSALGTEKANTVDLTLRHDSDSASWLISVFYNDYDNFVFATPTGDVEDDLPVVQYRQDAATLWGFEAEIWLPLYSGPATVRARLMSDYVRSERENGEALPQMPPLRMGAGVHVDRGAWHAKIEGIHHARQDRVAANELLTDRYLMLNADVSYRFDASVDWLLFLRGTNLLDEDARQHTSSLKDIVPLPGRAVNAGMRVSF